MLNLEEEKIQSARTKMQELWECKGFTDDEVLAASQEVDVLLNKFQSYFEQKIKAIQ
jgi:Spo0E like sporulation regulatory protein